MNLASPDMSFDPIDEVAEQCFSSQVASMPDSVSSSIGPIASHGGTMALPEDFEPGNYDVLCGRGKGCAGWIGNRRFRVTIAMNKERYLSAPTKVDKSVVVEEIVQTIASSSPTGGFVKKDLATGRWYKIDKQAARDKVGHAMRDAVKADERKKNEQQSHSSEARKRKASSSASASTSARKPSFKSTTKPKSRKTSTVATAVVPVMPPRSSGVQPTTTQVNNIRRSIRASIRQSFRGSIKDSELAAILLEALENSSDYDDLSLLTETALFRFEQGA